MNFCSHCGQERVGASMFCTGCGAEFRSEHIVAPPVQTSRPLVSPPPQVRQRQLRCMGCGTPIDSGLVCARCAAVAAPYSAASVAPNVSKSPRYTAPPKPGGKRSRWLWSIGTSTFAIALIFGALRSVDWSSHKLTMPSFGDGLDGVYVVEGDGPSGRLTIRDGHFDVLLPDGYSISGSVERRGNTIRFVDSQLYQNGYYSSEDFGSASRVDLGTLINDGQTIEITDGQHAPIDFVKQ